MVHAHPLSGKNKDFIRETPTIIDIIERHCLELVTAREGRNDHTRSLVAVEPRRPPMTDVGNETAFRLDQRKHFRKSKHLLRSEVNWCDQTSIELHLRRSTLILLVSRSINMLSVTDFDRKGIISGVRVQAGLYLDMLDADRSPNAVSVHAGTSQVDFEVDRPPPAPPGHLLITLVKEAVFCTKKMSFEKWKKSYLSLIWKWWKREMTARLPVTVSSLQTRFRPM